MPKKLPDIEVIERARTQKLTVHAKVLKNEIVRLSTYASEPERVEFLYLEFNANVICYDGEGSCEGYASLPSPRTGYFPLRMLSTLEMFESAFNGNLSKQQRAAIIVSMFPKSFAIPKRKNRYFEEFKGDWKVEIKRNSFHVLPNTINEGE